MRISTLFFLHVNNTVTFDLTVNMARRTSKLYNPSGLGAIAKLRGGGPLRVVNHTHGGGDRHWQRAADMAERAGHPNYVVQRLRELGGVAVKIHNMGGLDYRYLNEEELRDVRYLITDYEELMREELEEQGFTDSQKDAFGAYVTVWQTPNRHEMGTYATQIGMRKEDGSLAQGDWRFVGTLGAGGRKCD